MSSDLERIEAELKAIRLLLEKRGTSLEPMAVPMEEAARLLFCSARHVSRLVKSGSLITVPVGGLRRVPMTEIRRIASAPEVGQPRGSSRRPTSSMPESRPKSPRGFSAASFEAQFRASKLSKKKKR